MCYKLAFNNIHICVDIVQICYILSLEVNMPNPIEVPSDFGHQLAQLRKDAQKTQGELGSPVGMDASKVSRIEDGKVSPTASEVASLLHCLATPLAKLYQEYLEVNWRFSTRPPFGHPDLDSLEKAELGLQK